jgi:hypothetical protein
MPASSLSLDDMIDQALTALPRGRRAKSVAPTFLRNIQEEDMAVILSGEQVAYNVRPMLRIRTQHHLAAQLLASGKTATEVGAITGYTPVRINQLQKDPAFQELLAHYKKQTDAVYLSVHERLANLGITVTEEIQQRLEEDPESFSNEDLRKLAETTLDRGGYGPKSTREVNVNTRSVTLSLVETVKAEHAARGRVRQLGEEPGLDTLPPPLTIEGEIVEDA